MTTDELKQRVAQYIWYHEIDLGQGVVTVGSPFQRIWRFIERQMDQVPFAGKSVLDIACRDGLFSLRAEKLGASRVLGIDNDLSRGAVELVLPHLRSRVVMAEANLLSVQFGPEAPFDIVMMFGLLYHLRYPFQGLRKASQAVRRGGKLLIETACYLQNDRPLLFCPFREGNPYEPGSVSYFNEKALVAAGDSMGLTLRNFKLLEHLGQGDLMVTRSWFEFERTHEMPELLQQYWEGLHYEQSQPHSKLRPQ